MEWTDQGIVLLRRRHGETAAIVVLLTREHGRHLGLVRGGAGRRAGGVYQPGNLVGARWRARLAEHLGSYSCELTEAIAARFMDDALRLDALAACCALLDVALPEREAHTTLYDTTLDLLRGLAGPDWPAAYVRWECKCLAGLGFGLDLESCAATGETENLAYVSPRSGRAVGRTAGAPYADRLLRLPTFLADPAAGPPDAADVRDGLAITGHFLDGHVLAPHDRKMPAARTRFVDRWRRSATMPSR
ncbi:MAG: DNA repair protein RecO [Rhodospirillales bacterium]|nr:DNA repair protein RecO [Rhodospirillales bacterium]